MTEPPPTTEANQGLTALNDALRRSFSILRGLMVILLIAYLLSGLFIVRQHEKAVVLRFGKIAGIGDDRILNPGFHWTWPKPFSEVVRLPAGRVWTRASMTFWPSHPETDRENAPAALRPLTDGYTLAGDANILHSQWAIRFTIDDPELYLFHIQKPMELIERELNRAVLLVSAQSRVDDLLRNDLEGFRQKVEQECRRRLSALHTGIRVQGVDLLHASPPFQVADAFDHVVRTEQEQSQEITDARAYASRVLNEGRGLADQIIAEGEAFKVRLINDVKADADYISEIQPAVSRRPELMKQILWQEHLRQALGAVGQLYVVPSDQDGRREIRLQLSPRRQNPFAEGIP